MYTVRPGFPFEGYSSRALLSPRLILDGIRWPAVCMDSDTRVNSAWPTPPANACPKSGQRPGPPAHRSLGGSGMLTTTSHTNFSQKQNPDRDSSRTRCPAPRPVKLKVCRPAVSRPVAGVRPGQIGRGGSHVPGSRKLPFQTTPSCQPRTPAPLPRASCTSPTLCCRTSIHT